MRTTLALSIALSLVACDGGDMPSDAALPDDASVVTDAGPEDAGPSCGGGSTLEGVALPALDDGEGWACALSGLAAPARVTCLGENDHGVAESWAAHGHLTAHFAGSGGLDAVVLETGGAVGDRLDDFVRTGDEAALSAAMGALAGTLGGSRELEGFARHLRALAEASSDPLRVVGMDIAIRPDLAIGDLRAFLEAAALTLPEADACLDARPSSRTDAAIACDEVLRVLLDDRAGLETRVGALETERAIRNARNLAAGQRFLFHYEAGDFAAGSATREPAMFANLADIVGEETRAVVIGHNGHCGPGAVVGRDPSTGADVLSLGTAAEATFGDDYAVIAQLYRSGERTDFRTGRPAAYPDTASTLEGSFDALTEDAALLLSTESARLDFTASSRTAWGEPAFVPAERWDLVLWIRTVSPTDLRR